MYCIGVGGWVGCGIIILGCWDVFGVVGIGVYIICGVGCVLDFFGDGKVRG